MSVNTYINGQLYKVGGIAYYKAGQSIQVNEMPEASASLINRVYQYIGATTENYTHGFFYECVLEDDTYSWQILNTNPEMQSITTSNLANMWASGGGSSAVLIEKTISANGVYEASDDDADGYSKVTVDTGVDLMTQAAWDLLPTEDKQAMGLVALQTENSGYKRGILINGTDYQPANTYIPYSDNAEVLCAAYVDNFDASSETWGIGSSPAMYMDPSHRPSINVAENAVQVFSATNAVTPYVDKGTTSDPFTAYAVIKLTNYPNQYSRILCSVGDAQQNKAILMNGDPMWISAWSNDTSTSYSSTSDYVVICIRYGSSGDAAGYIYDTSDDSIYKVSKPTTMTDTVVVLCRSHISTTRSEPRDADAYVRFFGVVGESETDEVIEANMTNLYNTFVATT